MFSSEIVSHGIRVSVEPSYDVERSDPPRGNWFFLYTVTITNERSDAVQLLHRHWIVKDEEGRVEVVRGPGVVGEQPVLEPGESFSYTSGCPLRTATGTMKGSYRMVNAEGESFEAEIAPFVLSDTDVVH